MAKSIRRDSSSDDDESVEEVSLKTSKASSLAALKDVRKTVQKQQKQDKDLRRQRHAKRQQEEEKKSKVEEDLSEQEVQNQSKDEEEGTSDDDADMDVDDQSSAVEMDHVASDQFTMPLKPWTRYDPEYFYGPSSKFNRVRAH